MQAAKALITSFPSHRHHFPPEKRDLRRQRQVLRTDIMASEERHTAEDAIVIADQFIVIVVIAAVPRVDPEAGDLIQPHRADKVLPHPRRAATGDTTAALDAAIELINL